MLEEFLDRDRDMLRVQQTKEDVWITGESESEMTFLVFPPTTARLIAAALIEAANKAEGK